MMSRPEFVIAAAATLAAPRPGRAGTRPTAAPTTAAASKVDPVLARILGLAALAPSSHHVQPWIGIRRRRTLRSGHLPNA